MASNADNGVRGSGSRWRAVGWGLAVALLLLPFVAMKVTSEVNWSASDFIFAAVMIGLVGGIFEVTVRMSPDPAYRAGVAAALAAAFFIIWINGAVGMIGSEGNPYNLFFGGVILIAIVGAVAVRLRPAGMALTMTVAGAAHVAVALGGMAVDIRGSIFSAAFALPWLLSAWLFRKAARQG